VVEGHLHVRFCNAFLALYKFSLDPVIALGNYCNTFLSLNLKRDLHNYITGAVFTTLHFLCKLPMAPISYSVIYTKRERLARDKTF